MKKSNWLLLASAIIFGFCFLVWTSADAQRRDGAPVIVQNTDVNPVPVSAPYPKQPFCFTTLTHEGLFNVPDNKMLVIEFVTFSMNALFYSDPAPTWLPRVGARTNGIKAYYDLSPNVHHFRAYGGTEIWHGNASGVVRIYCDAGSIVEFRNTAYAETPIDYRVTITGYLVDVDSVSN